MSIVYFNVIIQIYNVYTGRYRIETKRLEIQITLKL